MSDSDKAGPDLAFGVLGPGCAGIARQRPGDGAGWLGPVGLRLRGAYRARLDELRASAQQSRLQAELDLGHHLAVGPLLSQLWVQ
jgi:hypothetical protein